MDQRQKSVSQQDMVSNASRESLLPKSASGIPREASTSQTSKKTLGEQLSEIQQYQKNSSRHYKREPVPKQEPMPVQTRKPSGVPNWMIYQGRTRHCCGGRCLFGSQPKWGVFSWVFFNIPPIILYATITPIYADQDLVVLVTCIVLALQVLTNLFYAMTVFCNPGIIPRSSLRARTQQNLESTRGKQQGGMVHQIIVGMEGAHLTRLKYCHTCLVFRPERAFHCHFCGNCTHRFDHHCKWLGTCIGGRNYKQFFLFLVSITSMMWACIIYTLWHIIVDLDIAIEKEHQEFGNGLLDTLKEAPSSIIILILSLITAGFVTHLLGYHIVVIVWQGMSTYESKKDHFVSYVMGNPYQMGHKRCYMLCRSRASKFFNFTEDEPLKVADSDRRCSLKVVTKDRDIRKVLKYHLIDRQATPANTSQSTEQSSHESNQLFPQSSGAMLEGITRQISRVNHNNNAKNSQGVHGSERPALPHNAHLTVQRVASDVSVAGQINDSSATSSVVDNRMSYRVNVTIENLQTSNSMQVSPARKARDPRLNGTESSFMGTHSEETTSVRILTNNEGSEEDGLDNSTDIVRLLTTTENDTIKIEE